VKLRNSIVDVLIVGSGPYGLSLAAHLRQFGVEFRIFGTPMQSWRTAMPKGMFLKSEGGASNLSDPDRRFTLSQYCASRKTPYSDIGLPVPVQTFVAYGLAFQRELVPEVEENRVVALGERHRLFNVRLDTGEELRARKVVIAVGTTYFEDLPMPFASLPSELVSHSRDHRDFGRFSRSSVLVIGGGQSALESAALLHEQGADVRVLVREPILFWNPAPQAKPSAVWKLLHPPSSLGAGWKTWFYSNAPDVFKFFPQQVRASIVRNALGPAGAWWLKNRVEGRFPVSLGHVVQKAEEKGGKACLSVARSDGNLEEIRADHVITATGYKVDIRSLPFLDRALMPRMRVYSGSPVLSSNFESSIPGLYFTGLAAAQQFGPYLRFVAGTEYAARKISNACRSRVGSAVSASSQLRESTAGPQTI
jgi:FAD-dependent urate hydroxylase